MSEPKYNERWRASYEGLVIHSSAHPSRDARFALVADGQTVPEEFWTAPGWVYERLDEPAETKEQLIASGGWCAPTEQMYNLMPGEWTIEDYKAAWLQERAKRKEWKRRAKIAEAKLLLGRRK